MNVLMCFKCYRSVAIIIINTVNIMSDIDTWSFTNELPQGTYLLHFPSSVSPWFLSVVAWQPFHPAIEANIKDSMIQNPPITQWDNLGLNIM